MVALQELSSTNADAAVSEALAFTVLVVIGNKVQITEMKTIVRTSNCSAITTTRL